MKIALCDAIPFHLDLLSFYIKQALDATQLPGEFLSFSSLKTLLNDHLKDPFDLLFIDIPPKYSQFPSPYSETELRALFTHSQKQQCPPLIVLTFSDELPTFLVKHPFVTTLLHKPYVPEDIKSLLLFCFHLYEKQFPHITIKESRQLYQIPIHHILYTETDNHYIVIHTKERILRTYLSRSDFLDLLKPYSCFSLYKHAGVVNLNHISTIEGTCCILSNHERLIINRPFIKTLLHDFNQNKL